MAAYHVDLPPDQHLLLHQCWPNDCCLCRAEQEARELRERVQELETENARLQTQCALSIAMEFGDRLVELGLWERHPDGHGRRWWYRPKTSSIEVDKTA